MQIWLRELLVQNKIDIKEILLVLFGCFFGLYFSFKKSSVVKGLIIPGARTPMLGQ